MTRITTAAKKTKRKPSKAFLQFKDLAMSIYREKKKLPGFTYMKAIKEASRIYKSRSGSRKRGPAKKGGAEDGAEDDAEE